MTVRTSHISQNLLTRFSSEMAAEFERDGYWTDSTIYDNCAMHARKSPDRVAIRDRFGSLTYADVVSPADAVAADLALAGLKPGDRVASWMSSRCEVAVLLAACSKGGFVLCPSLHRNHTVGEIAELVTRMNARALYLEDGFGADADKVDASAALSQASDILRFVRLQARTERSAENMRKALVFEDHAAGAKTPYPGRANDIVYLAFTSGTTGEPKGVMHSNNTLLANARAIAADWGFNGNTVTYTLGPLSHNLGFGALVLTLLVGCELIIHDLPKGRSLLKRLRDTGTTFLFGVPAHAIDLLKEIESNAGDETLSLRGLKGFRISGAAVPAWVVERLAEYEVKAQSGYGMTEACSHHYTLPDDTAEQIANTSGKACPGYEIGIFAPDDPNKPLPAGEIGHIGGRGASLMMGYFDDQTATEKTFNRDGWFMTGDLGKLDDEGYLTITGRLKEIIIRGGHNIHPARIEQLAMRFPSVERAAAIGMADERLGEKVCLVVMPRSGKNIDVQEVLRHLDKAGLSKYDMPEYFLTVDEIPLSASGKILKRALLQSIASGAIKPEPIRYQP